MERLIGLWLATTNSIGDGWPGYDWWLASVNDILSGCLRWIND
jgi:hypothetical protein